MKCIKKFDEMMKQLNKAELPIAKVEEVFGPYRNDTDGILVELISVENILTVENLNLSGDIYKKVYQCLKMTENRNVAEITMKIKDILGVEKNFVEVDKILRFGNNAEFSDDEQLKSISEKDIELGEIFLD